MGSEMCIRDSMEIDYDGEHLIDGQVVDYDQWPLYEAPGGTQAEVGTGRMRFAHGSAVVDVDFELDPARKLMPMRVIG